MKTGSKIRAMGQKLNQQTQRGATVPTLEDKQATNTGVDTTAKSRNNANTYKIKEAR